MNETSLRWQGRIGSLKSLGLVIAIMAGLSLVAMVSQLMRALQSPTEPTALSIPDLLAGTARANPYVSVIGDAYYNVGYEETENDRVVRTYYLLVDDRSGQTIVVRASTPETEDSQHAKVTVTGIIHTAPSDLQALIRADLPGFSQQGITLDPTFYLGEGERPPGVVPSFIWTALAGGFFLLGLFPLFLPSSVFQPRPVEALAAPPAATWKASGIRTSGRFRQLKRMQPQLELGKRWMKFSNAVANLITLPDARLMIYIHHVQRTTLYGVVTVSKHESDWAVMLDKNAPLQIDPGILYGWKARPAVRFVSRESNRKAEALYVSFDQTGSQAEFVRQLRGLGFPVGMGY